MPNSCLEVPGIGRSLVYVNYGTTMVYCIHQLISEKESLPSKLLFCEATVIASPRSFVDYLELFVITAKAFSADPDLKCGFN